MALPKNPYILNDFPLEFVSLLAQKEGNAKKPIYQIHKWWARRLGSVFRTILLSAVSDFGDITNIEERFYAQNSFPDLVVMDPFMGGGTSVIESLKIGAKVIGNDIDPMAWFTTKNEIEAVDLDELDKQKTRIIDKLNQRVEEYYFTEVEREKKPVVYFFWVDTAKCLSCKQKIKLHIHYYLLNMAGKNQPIILCPECGFVFEGSKTIKQICVSCKYQFDPTIGIVKRGKFRCGKCDYSGSISSLRKNNKPLKKYLYAIEYLDNGTSYFKKANSSDRKLYQEAKKEFQDLEIKLSFPRTKIPQEGRSDNRPMSSGYYSYKDLFNYRQLLTLSLLYGEIVNINSTSIRSALLTAFSDCLASNNMLCTYAFGYKKLTPLFSIHAYSVMNQSVENNVLGVKLGRGSFIKCVQKLIRGKKYGQKPYESIYKNGYHIKKDTGEIISTRITANYSEFSDKERCLLLNGNSENLHKVPDSGVDIILTDPPYYNNLAYSELSDFYFQWIKGEIKSFRGDHTPLLETLYVTNSESEDRYKLSLIKIFIECSKKLKEDGLMIFTFHHVNPKAWSFLTEAILSTSLLVEKVYPIRSEGSSGFHSFEGSLKWDSIIVCRKKSTSKKEGLKYDLRIDFKYWVDRINKSKLTFSNQDKKSFIMSLMLKSICIFKAFENTNHEDSILDTEGILQTYKDYSSKYEAIL